MRPLDPVEASFGSIRHGLPQPCRSALDQKGIERDDRQKALAYTSLIILYPLGQEELVHR